MDARRSKSKLQSDPIQARGQEQLLHPWGAMHPPCPQISLIGGALAELLLTTQWLPKGEEHNTQNNSDGLSWGDYGVSGFRKHEIADTLGQGFYDPGPNRLPASPTQPIR
jgi:hypothetical protein